MGTYLQFVTIDVWTMVFTLGNLVILFLLVKRFLFKPVTQIMEKRAAQVQTMYDSAKQSEEQAQAMKSEYEERLAAAKQEASEIVKDAGYKAQLRSEELIKEAQQQASNLVARAEQEIAQDKKKAMNEIKDEISGIAVDIATKVVAREISAKDHEKLIEEFINHVGEAS